MATSADFILHGLRIADSPSSRFLRRSPRILKSKAVPEPSDCAEGKQGFTELAERSRALARMPPDLKSFLRGERGYASISLYSRAT